MTPSEVHVFCKHVSIKKCRSIDLLLENRCRDYVVAREDSAQLVACMYSANTSLSEEVPNLDGFLVYSGGVPRWIHSRPTLLIRHDPHD